VEKAKGILMKKNDMNEDDAYNALRKMAMDKNIKIAAVAKSVVEVADLLG
jgi:response regulator NasT